jgi:hypothetical protein
MQAQVHGGSGTYQFSWERNGELLDGQTSSNLAGQSFVKGDTVTVVVMTESGEVRTSKTVGNSPPGVASVAFVDPFVHRGVDLVAAPDGFDLDGDPVEYHYQWSINGEEVLGNDTPTLAGDQFRKGDRIDLTIIPFDAEGEGRPFRGVEFTIPNAPPSFVTTPPETFKGTQYSYKPVAQDPDDDSVTYQLESAPEGMAIDPQSGQIEWAIGTEQMGEHRIRIVARDDEGTQAVQEYILTLAILESLNQ